MVNNLVHLEGVSKKEFYIEQGTVLRFLKV